MSSIKSLLLRYTKLKEAQDSGTFPLNIALSGFGDLAKQDGNYVEKTSIKGTYTIGDKVQITSLTKGDFYHSQETKSDGTRYVLPEMTTMNVSVYYKFDIGDNKARMKFAVKNIEDERAPLADRFYGFLLTLTKITVEILTLISNVILIYLN